VKIIILRISAIVITLFALLTLFMSGSVIFDLFGIRAKEGNYVLFIVVSNFVCGIIYLFSAVGLYAQKKWTTRLLILSVAILILSFNRLLLHISSGGLYETQTVKAMIFRISITLLFAGVSWYYISRQSGIGKTS
jgi:hypothetical protein